VTVAILLVAIHVAADAWDAISRMVREG